MGAALPIWTTACPDWERRIVAGESLIPFPPLFPAEAAAGLEVFDSLRMVDAAGSPLMGEVSREWTREFVAAIFGSYNPESGRRLIREIMLLISKKNAKSTNAAGIMLTALTRNWREEGEFLILAPTKEIADNSFKPAWAMIKNDDALADLYHVSEHTRTITHRTNGANLKIVAADSNSVGGKKAIGVFVDELWLFGKQPGAANMLLEATGGLAARPEGFVIYATTQSDEPPAGVMAEKLAYARGVRDGRIVDPKFMPILYEFPKAMIAAKAYEDPKHFYITNPNLGASVDEEDILREKMKADLADQSARRSFYAKRLNVEIGLALGGQRWVGADHWEQNGGKVKSLKDLLERSEVITCGIDGGGLDDMLGLAFLGREEASKKWLHWGHAWIHAGALERHKQEAARFRDFERDGDLTIYETPDGSDVQQLGDYVEEVEESGLLDRVGVDQAGIGLIVDEVIARGVEFERVLGIPQGWKLVGAIKTAERMLGQFMLEHQGSRLMNFAVGNARAEARGNAIIITKQGSGNAKIDPLSALFDAVALMAMNPKPRKKKFKAFFY